MEEMAETSSSAAVFGKVAVAVEQRSEQLAEVKSWVRCISLHSFSVFEIHTVLDEIAGYPRQQFTLTLGAMVAVWEWQWDHHSAQRRVYWTWTSVSAECCYLKEQTGAM